MRAIANADTVFAPLDRARHALLSVLARLSPSLVGRREPRVAFFGTLLIALGFLLTAIAPLWLLLVGPIILGVPHVVSDVRYLVARPKLHRRWPLWLLIGIPLAGCAVGFGVRAGLVAVCGALLGARGRVWIRALGIASALALLAVVWKDPRFADLVFAHLHNFIAVAMFIAWRRREGKLHWFPIAAFAFGAALLLFGVAEPSIARFPYTVGVGLVPRELATIGGRVVALYAFAQAVHYTMWLRLIPEEDRQRPTPRTFASTFRALAGDLGPWVLGAAMVAAIGFAVYALFDLASARNRYLELAIFHGHLEIAAGALLFVERRLPTTS
jgi:hypothetical protein